MTFGLVLGTGFAPMATDSEPTMLNTPYGKVTVFRSSIGGLRVHTTMRHGELGRTPAHLTNMKGNLWAFRKLGVNRILAMSAVGILRTRIRNKPLGIGQLVLPDDLLDISVPRQTFYDGTGIAPKGPVYITFDRPYCPATRQTIIAAAKEKGVSLIDGGTYVQVPGPRFSTPAEINAYRLIGGDLTGMTNGPESSLARELEMCYATICVCTNYTLSRDEDEISRVEDTVAGKLQEIRSIIKSGSSRLSRQFRNCDCAQALNRYPRIRTEWARVFGK